MGELIDYLIIITTASVALATILMWLATREVARATKATNKISQEISTYPIIPRLELKFHERQQQDRYYQYSIKMVNNGKGDAYNVKVETKSNEISSSEKPSFHLPVGYMVWIQHSVKPNEKTINFSISFEDVAGNKHFRKLDYYITDDKLKGDAINYEAGKPFPDPLRFPE